ncbi:MAG: hypothetical protein ACXWQQ_04220 [Pseudobdellovibrio sp.]
MPEWKKSAPADVKKISKEEFEKQFGADVFKYPSEFDKLYDFEKYAGSPLDNRDLVDIFNELHRADGSMTLKERRFIKGKPEDKIFEVEYLKTAHHRRVVEKQDEKTKSDQFLILAGDSFVFGVGVNQGLDYPSQLRKKIDAKKWKIYNFGKPGYGINDGLFDLTTQKDYLSEVSEDEGIVVWHMINPQIQRAIFSLNNERIENVYNSEKPYYELNDSGLSFYGRFNENRTLKRKLLSLLSKSKALGYFNFDWPMRIDDDEFDLISQIFVDYKKALQQQKKIEDFVVLLDPTTTYNFEVENYMERIEKNLNQHGIKTVLIPRFDNKEFEAKAKIPIEGHPSPAQDWLYSEIIKNKIINNR